MLHLRQFRKTKLCLSSETELSEGGKEGALAIAHCSPLASRNRTGKQETISHALPDPKLYSLTQNKVDNGCSRIRWDKHMK